MYTDNVCAGGHTHTGWRLINMLLACDRVCEY